MKKIFLLICLVLLFLISCSTSEEIIIDQGEDIGLEEDFSDEDDAVADDGAESITLILPDGQCLPQWRCISNSIKAYQLENCSFGERKDCELGCENDDCKKRDPCTVGFKCKNQYIKGYQLESCDWTSTTRCEFGCQDAECLNETEAEVELVETEVEEVSPRINVLTIKAGEQQEVGGHNLSLYIIEESRARLIIDEKRSDWLEEGEIFSAKGVTVVVVGVLFQAYQGGMQAVEYTVG